MRKILFRGKRKDNGEWIEGSSINTQYDVSGKKHVYIGIPVISEMYPLMQTIEWIEVIPETVGQYTGLTDNGKKIFEGDIIKHYYDNTDKSMFDIGVILFDDKVCQFKRNSRVNTRYYNIHFECEYEVIGNIHDNPELLKGEEENA